MLNIERLKEISSAVKVPLVLHGGSGLSDDDFKNTIRNGIAKVNICTDLCLAGEFKGGLYQRSRKAQNGFIRLGKQSIEICRCIKRFYIIFLTKRNI